MSITELAFKNDRLLLSIIALLMVFGVTSYFNLPAQEDPKVKIREAVITTEYPGLSAEKVELLISKTVEEAVRRLPEIKEVRSISMVGRSIVHVQIQDKYFELAQIWDDMRDELDLVMSELPQGTQTPIVNDAFGDVAVITLALLADEGYTMGERFDVAQHVRDNIYTVPGTKRVDLLGVIPEQIVIEISNTKLAQMGIPASSIIGQLQSQNVIRPGGEIDIDGSLFSIRPTGNFANIDDISNTLISIPGTQTSVLMQDIATIKREAIDPAVVTSFFMGKPAIVFAISKNDDADVLNFSPKVDTLVTQLNQTLPAGYSIETITRQADVVATSVEGVSKNVVITLALVSSVVILFLGTRTGFIVGSIVPTVVLITFSIMAFSNMALERMSLATLIIALGILVDNGIVVAEDFKRRLEDGESRDSALTGIGKSLAIPLLTSSLTTILVFLPLMLADSASGEYTRSVSLVILISLLVSWALSITFTPYLCYHFVKLKNAEEQSKMRRAVDAFFEKLNPAYEIVLRKLLIYRKTYMLGMFGLFMLGGIGMSLVPVKFFPDSDRSQILVYADLPAGSSMQQTNTMLQDIFAKLDDKTMFPHIQSHVGYGGFGGPRFVLSLTPIDIEASKGFIVIDVGNRKYADETIQQLRNTLSSDFVNVRANVTKMFLGPSDSSKIDIQIKGFDADYVFETGKKIEQILAGIPDTYDINNDWENKVTQVRVEIDQYKARRAGISSADIAQALQTSFSGYAVTSFREGDDILPVLLRSPKSERYNASRLQSVVIHSSTHPNNPAIPLMQVAEIKFETVFARIARENLFRTVTVEAKNLSMNAEDMVPLLQAPLDELRASLPPGYVIEFDGVVQDSAEAQASLNKNLPLCLLMIALLLIAQFRSIRKTGIIVGTMPLIIIGASAGLLLMQANFGFMVILGLYALAGIIINNSIVLIDRIDLARHTDEHNDFDAIIYASIRRLRPIIMSTFTTILGLLPLIISGDALFYGMASAIAFGLLVGTLLTLGVVPVLYSLLFKITPK